MPDRVQRSWMRIWTEGLVIVASILLAFGIDAAWDDRGERQKRAALLGAISGDMTRARAEVARVHEFHSNGKSAAGDLLNMTRLDVSSEAQALLVDSLLTATWASTASYDAPVGAVESLFGAGALDLVADPALAFELTAFPALVADLAREQVQLQGASDDLRRYLGAQGLDVSMLPSTYYDIPWEVRPTNAATLLDSPEFRGMVSMMWYKYHNTTVNLDKIREAIARVEALTPPP